MKDNVTLFLSLLEPVLQRANTEFLFEMDIHCIFMWKWINLFSTCLKNCQQFGPCTLEFYCYFSLQRGIIDLGYLPNSQPQQRQADNVGNGWFEHQIRYVTRNEEGDNVWNIFDFEHQRCVARNEEGLKMFGIIKYLEIFSDNGRTSSRKFYKDLSWAKYLDI